MIDVDDPVSPTEPDQLDGAPHPREAKQLFGHQAAQESFLEAFNTGRLHHAWLISGPRGVGKATLAWRLALFLLATPTSGDGAGLFGVPPAPDSLDIAPDHPIARRLRARSEPRLFHVTRSRNDKTGRLRDQILAEDVRGLAGFFGLKAADGGRRVVILDAADDMNIHAANALLKMLEEPPADTILLLLSHRPGQLLPTIRSRCRILPLTPLGAEDLGAALAQAGFDPGQDQSTISQLSEGSVGTAIRLLGLDGGALYADIVALMNSLPGLDRPRVIKMTNALVARGAEAQLDLLYDLIELLLGRMARAGASGSVPPEAVPGEGALIARLSCDAAAARAWAECAARIGARSRHGRSVNLDPATLVLDTVFELQRTAQAV
ncbi:MAG: DNA polymerase III subunit delta' [Pseudomonadota bacterium]